MDHYSKEFDIWVDSFGYLQVKAKTHLLETFVDNIIKQRKFTPFMTETFIQNQIKTPLIKQQIIYPIIDVLQ